MVVPMRSVRDLYHRTLDARGLLPRGGEPSKPAMSNPEAGSIPSSNMSTQSGPTFLEAAGGAALPAGAPPQVGVMDRGWGGMAMMAPWYMPLPGRSIGSYVPTPPLDVFPDAPSAAPFIEPAVSAGGTLNPGFGMGFGLMPWFSQQSDEEQARARAHNPLDFGGGGMLNTSSTLGSGTLGAESFLDTLANLVAGAGQTVLAYQQQKYASRAQEKYGAPETFTLVQPQAQAEFASVPEVVTTAPAPPEPRKFNPMWLAAGGLALVFLMKRR